MIITFETTTAQDAALSEIVSQLGGVTAEAYIQARIQDVLNSYVAQSTNAKIAAVVENLKSDPAALDAAVAALPVKTPPIQIKL